MVSPNSPRVQLRDFLIQRFAGDRDLEGFVADYFEELAPEIGWESNLANQARDFTTVVISHGLLDRLWPALRAERPGLVQDIDGLAGLDWTARPRLTDSMQRIDMRWLAGGAVALLVAVAVVVMAVSGSGDDPAPATTVASPQPTTTTTTAATQETILPTTTATDAPAEPAPQTQGPPLRVSSIKALNGDDPAEQSAIQLLVANMGDVAVNVDRVSFEVVNSDSVDCLALPATGGGVESLFARGASSDAYSVPIYEYARFTEPGLLTLNPPRRFAPDGEETLLLFDLDQTTIPRDDDVDPPYTDERYLVDGKEEVGFAVFELAMLLETTTGEQIEAGTVVVAHPRLDTRLLSASELSAACGWDDSDEAGDLEGIAVVLEQNLAAVAQFCDSPEHRGWVGGNEQINSLLQSVASCE